MRSFTSHCCFSMIIIFIFKITKLTESNFVKWLIDIWVLLQQNKFWKYVQKNALKKMKNMNIKKWEKITDIMTLILLSEIKKKLTEKKFNNEFKMLTKLMILLQSESEIQFMKLIYKYYTLHFDESLSKILSEFVIQIKVLKEWIDVINVTMNNNKHTLFCLLISLLSRFCFLIQIWSATWNEQHYSRKDNSNAIEREVKNKEWCKTRNRIWISVCSSHD